MLIGIETKEISPLIFIRVEMTCIFICRGKKGELLPLKISIVQLALLLCELILVVISTETKWREKSPNYKIQASTRIKRMSP